MKTPEELLTQSTRIHSEQDVEQAIDAVAALINQTFLSTPIVLICVMSGGLFFCGKLMAKLKMPIELDYVQANRYMHNLNGGEIHWVKRPSLDLNQKTVLLVDDILDEGITLNEVHQECIGLGALSVHTAVLVDKLNGLNKPLRPDFVGLEVPNQFVFGCGMDAYGWWRNLAEIRAII